jgi:hemolysin III
LGEGEGRLGRSALDNEALGHAIGGRTWWHKGRGASLGELIADGIVHGVGLVNALVFGTLIVVFAVIEGVPELPALIVYIASLVVVLSVSLAYNLAPISPLKRVLARFDQAAIFLFIAGTYTPFIAVMGGSEDATLLMTLIWGASLIGVALKLIVPHRFGRMALPLYLGIGWSGALVFSTLARTLPVASLWLVVAGGIVYSLGIVFHLWERLKFQNALWHAFVVCGATLHLVAILVLTLNR